jgi:hypothetical protein
MDNLEGRDSGDGEDLEEGPQNIERSNYPVR